MAFLTREGATFEIPDEDVTACRAAGDAWTEGRAGAHSRMWGTEFDRSEEPPMRERVAAHVLEWGRGVVLCPACHDVFPANVLCKEEACFDGIHRRRFFCPAGHRLFTTPENVFGEMNERRGFDRRPTRRAAPWLPWRRGAGR